MQVAIEILGYGGLIPIAVSIAIVFLCRRFLPPRISNRYSAAIGFATAFFVGYVLLPPWASLQPSRSWQWLPYLGLVAMTLGPMGLAEGLVMAERWVLYLMIALLSAWLVVPVWPDLQPLRPVYIASLAGVLFLLSILLDLLPARTHGPSFLAHLSIVSVWSAIMLAVFVSVKFGQVAGVAASAMAGCFTASCFDRRQCISRGLIPAFAVVVGGLNFVGYITPKPPVAGLLLVPAAPLALWSCAAGPLARFSGKAALAIQLVAVLVPLGIALAWVMVEEGGQ